MILTEPVPLKMGPEEEKVRNTYVYENIDSIKRGLVPLTENKIKEWRRLKDGIPEKDTKTFPWRGASNLVIQVIATNIDTLLAQVMASIYEVLPVWPCELVGDQSTEMYAEEKRNTMEEFLNLMAMEKDELDLYRIESQLFDGAIGYGYMAAKTPWVLEQESVCIGEQNGPSFTEFDRVNGPKPTIIPLEDFGFTPRAESIDSARFKYHVLRLTKHDLMERKFLKKYDADKIDLIMSSPDRGGPTQTEKDKQQSTGAYTQNSTLEQEWDLYECHYPYIVNIGGQDRKISIIETYHFSTKTSMRALYNWYPNNENIFTVAQLGYTDRGITSLGYCEMLKHSQIEVSSQHNRYADNGTLANTSIYRVDPDVSSRLDASFSLFPTSILPAKESEFEVFNIGRQSDNGIDNERQALELVKARTGLDNGMSAAGGGVINPKRGIYSAQATFSALQAGNRRGDLRKADLKYAHVDIGRKVQKLYAYYGIGKRLRYFGKDGEYLKIAFDDVQKGLLRIPVRASTGSINREMEKQTMILLMPQFRQHYQAIAQVLQALPQAPQHMQDYLLNIIIANDMLMRRMAKVFGFDDLERLVPEPAIITKIKEQQKNVSKQRKEQLDRTLTAGIDAETTGATLPAEQVQSDHNETQGAGLVPVQ